MLKSRIFQIVYSQGRFVMKLASGLSLLSIGASYLGASLMGYGWLLKVFLGKGVWDGGEGKGT